MGKDGRGEDDEMGDISRIATKNRGSLVSEKSFDMVYTKWCV